jgi:methionyl-tRNA synthetase
MKSQKNAKPTYYITTPIYYPSGKWHIGHCYTTVCCDALARYKRMSGFDVFYLTGTDEHGQKIEKRAVEAGKSPKEFVDGVVDNLKELWSVLDISYDKFLRTTDDFHVEGVQRIFKALYDKGDIYKAKYRGKYCTPCESFWTETQAKDGLCPDCGREVTEAEEECYFFALSKYRDKLLKLLTETDFLEPKSRVNEMVNNFLKDGLEDLAVSRTSFKWGIPVSFDSNHVVYVWIDALSNYVTGLGYGGGDDSPFKKFWPADVHMMAKEIVRFHSIIWPAILMALDLPLPKKVYGHGWILFGGDKMSKSKGNIVDPFILSNRYGVDGVRYFLLREIPFGADCSYSSEIFLNRLNSDLANDFGNLCKRTLTMAKQYFKGVVQRGGATEFDAELEGLIGGLKARVDGRIDKLNINKALEDIFEVIGRANKYIDLTKPWELFKARESEKLKTVIYNLLEALRVSANMLCPFLTKTPQKVFAALGVKTPADFSEAKYGAVKRYSLSSEPIETFFPRFDVVKELNELAAIEAAQNPSAKAGEKAAEKPEEKKVKERVSIEDFLKTELRVATVRAAEKVEKADKLLKLTLELDGETRTVVSGIAKSYAPESLVGKQVVLAANLKPAVIRGIESKGMILCAVNGDKVVIVSPESLVRSGSEVC